MWIVAAVALTLGLCMALFVARPLRREAMAAQQRLAQAVRANEALQARLETALAAAAACPSLPPRAISDHPKAQQTALWQPDALTATLAAALDGFVARGQAAVHPDEASVQVVVPADVAQAGTLVLIIKQIANALQGEGGPWAISAQMGRPTKSRRGTVQRAWRAQAAGLLADLDGAMGPAQIPWTASLNGIRPGQVVLVVVPAHTPKS